MKTTTSSFFDSFMNNYVPYTTEMPSRPDVKTNGDRIRAMSDEELAELWWERVDCESCPVHKECFITGQDCKRRVLDWLQSPAGGDGE